MSAARIMFAVGTELRADVSGTAQPNRIIWFVESFGNPHEQRWSACRTCSQTASGNLYATWDGDATKGARTRLFAGAGRVVAAQRSLWQYPPPHLHVAVDASMLTEQMAPTTSTGLSPDTANSRPSDPFKFKRNPVELLDKFSWLISIHSWWRHCRLETSFIGSRLPIEIRVRASYSQACQIRCPFKFCELS